MKDLTDPELAVVFTALKKNGFPTRLLFKHVYGMTDQEAAEAWQMFVDEAIDTSAQALDLQFHRRGLKSNG